MKQTANRDTVVLIKAGREKPVRQQHPWIFSGAIQQLPASVADGEVVDVCSAAGEWLARGYLNRQSQIQVRLLSWQPDEAIDAAFWQRRLQRAIELRRTFIATAETNAYRLINGESDYLPGLVVDQYADYLVMQVGTLGIERRKVDLANQLLALTGCRGVIERSDLALRRQEGLPEAIGLLAGVAPSGPVDIQESGFRYQVDLTHGQKSGFYTDQRDNRRRVAAYGQGGRVLNAFSYTAAFAVHALAAGAHHVTNIDTSVDALTVGETHLRLNGFDPDQQAEQIAGDVFSVLRDWRVEGVDPFDMIILDPPKFAQSRGNLDRALRGYKDLTLRALRLLNPGGMLATYSCSQRVTEAIFQEVTEAAAADARRALRVVERVGQPADHPEMLGFPEGRYLKGLILEVV
jgi:23S rRNA (cytosine1962-C5)-methyltransferase